MILTIDHVKKIGYSKKKIYCKKRLLRVLVVWSSFVIIVCWENIVLKNSFYFIEIDFCFFIDLCFSLYQMPKNTRL